MSLKNLNDLASAEFHGHFQQPPGSFSPQEELAHWQQLCREIIQERDRLREDLARTEKERDDYRKSLYAFTQKDIPFTRQEVFAQLGKEESLRDLVAELERTKGQ
jgi:hypothetical protein